MNRHTAMTAAGNGAALSPVGLEAQAIGPGSEAASTLTVSEPGSFRLCAQAAHEAEALDELLAVSMRVRDATRCFAACGLLLTGSFARGEGTIVRDDFGITRWLSDLEFLLVFDDRLRPARAAVGAAVERACAAINQEPARRAKRLRVEVSPIAASRLARMRPAIFTNELAVHGKLLWGEPAVVLMPPAMAPGYDLRADALRLLNNRIVEHLRARVQHEIRSADHLTTEYSLRKFWADMATSLSVFMGCYAASYQERGQRMAASLAGRRAGSIADIITPLSLRLEGAMSFKRAKSEIPRAGIDRELSTAAATAARLWWWETGDMLRDDPRPAGWSEIAPRLRRIQTRGQCFRNWAKLLLRSSGRSRLSVRTMPAAIRAGSFGNAIYAAGCAVAFFWDDLVNEAHGGDLAAALSRLLGVAPASNNERRRRFVERIFEDWAQHLRSAAI